MGHEPPYSAPVSSRFAPRRRAAADARPPARPAVLAIAPSVELYGADRMFLRAMTALAAAGGPAVATVVAPAAGELTGRIAAAGISVTVSPFQVLRKSLLGPRAAVALPRMSLDVVRACRLIRRELAPGGIVYVNTLTAPQWLLAARLTGRRCVCHVREREAGRRLVELALVLPLLLCDQVIANSRATAEWLASVAPTLRPRTTVIYNGVPLPECRRSRPSAGRRPPRVLVVGRLSPRKGQDLLIESVARLVRSGTDLSVTLVGDVFPGYEWYRDELRALVARHGLADVVHFAGFQADPAPYYRDADVLVVPSRNEPFGTVALEGMAHGLPVVAAAVAGLREIVVDGVTGRLVPAESVDALADALGVLVTDPRLRQRLGAAGLDRARRSFSVAEYDARMTALLLGGCSGHKDAAIARQRVDDRGH
ncbi:MAG: glycosyltransferase family 4 protein [Frankia sp.]|nr:glycosyltransferase family 4 protein [Frankia sp.]